MELTPQIRLEARKELARRFFYDYCRLKYPKHYTDDRRFLKSLCETMQRFTEQNKKRFLVVTIPPRHFKSFSGTGFVEWYFGQDPQRKVMTGSYNETLSTTFARKVRDTIEEKPVAGGPLVYGQIFPNTRVKYGQASASLWALEGSSQDNYLATSPTGTATGFGANCILVDDIIKNAEEAYNEAVLDKHWSWFTNTAMQRLEGDDWKVIVIMTRWATNDLAGRILASYDDVEHISFSAVQEDGTMLCDSILNRRDYDLKTKEMNQDIVEANYNQKPIDVTGRLFSEFGIYESLPSTPAKRMNYTDTADKGTDFLCSVDYEEHDGDVYVTDVVMTDDGMEETEPAVAAMLDAEGVDEATVESNNGGRGFARNIERLLKDVHGNRKCVVNWVAQTANKEARILASSAWVNKHVFMPQNWKHKYPEFYKQLMAYQKKGKNKHDDAPDVLAAIYERVANPARSNFRVRTA
jgi:predicted phage terminase large subunit-like protein